MPKKGFLLFLTLSFFILSLYVPTYGAGDNSQGKVLATVNGENITMEDFDHEFGFRSAGLEEQEGNPEQIRRFLDKAIERKLLVQEAFTLGLDQDPHIVRQLAELRQRLVIDALYKRITAKELTDERLEQYYQQNKGKYTREMAGASHILVKTEAEAAGILKQLKEGTSFEVLAKKHSLDPSRDKGGDLGFIQRGKMAPEFDQALFELKKVGDISPVIKTRFGYHIIKLTREAQLNTEPFSRVKNMIRRDLERELLGNYVNKLKAKAKISVSTQYR